MVVERKVFDWRRDVGNIEPSQVESMARQSGQTLEEFARDFAKQWPFGGEPTEEQVKAMVEEMRRSPKK